MCIEADEPPGAAFVMENIALDQLALAANLSAPGGPLHGCVLEDLVALGGHSMGGGTAILAASASISEPSIPAIAGLVLMSPGLLFCPSTLPTIAALVGPGGPLPSLLILKGDLDFQSECSENLFSMLEDDAGDMCLQMASIADVGHCEWADYGCSDGRFPGPPGAANPTPQDVMAFHDYILPLIVQYLSDAFQVLPGGGHAFDATALHRVDMNLTGGCREPQPDPQQAGSMQASGDLVQIRRPALGFFLLATTCAHLLLSR